MELGERIGLRLKFAIIGSCICKVLCVMGEIGNMVGEDGKAVGEGEMDPGEGEYNVGEGQKAFGDLEIK